MNIINSLTFDLFVNVDIFFNLVHNGLMVFMFKYKTIDIWKICCVYRIKTSIFPTLMEQIYKKKYKNNLRLEHLFCKMD